MQYRPYGKVGFDVSAFGMGLMRLPQNAEGKIDYDEAYNMVHYAIENGVNYFDTAYVYHEQESEVFIGKALAGGFREKVKLATKMPIWEVKTLDDAKRLLDTELQRLQTDYIDCYLMHALDKNRWEQMKEIGLPEYFAGLKKQGVIGAVCFSFHDDYTAFKKIVDENEWDMAQIQMNYLDANNQATLEGMRYAHEKGLAVVIMEPLRGGSLARIPAEVQNAFDAYPEKRTAAEWAFRYMYDFAEVSTILSGVSTMGQLQENIALFNNAQPNTMTADERAVIAQAVEIFEARTRVPCTGCAYCVPCPAGVEIPSIFEQVNYASVMDDMPTAKRRYLEFAEKGGADKCIECAACEALCPQHIEIIEELKNAEKYLGV